MSTDGSGAGDQARRADEDAAWRDIVAHFGERAELAPEELEPDFGDDVDQQFPADPDTYGAAHNALAPSYDPLDEEHFVPELPPALPRMAPERLLAWLGVLGAPVVVLALVIVTWLTNWAVPSWVDAFLVVGFLGGFGYLVATMAKDHDDPYDDGARV